MFGDQNVLKYGKILEQSDILERTGNAHLGYFIRSMSDHPCIGILVFSDIELFHFPLGMIGGDDLFFVSDASVCGFINTGDAVECRGFPRPVGADEGYNFSPVYLQGKVIQGNYTAKLHGQVFHLKNMIRHAGTSPFFFFSERFRRNW